jgi:ribosome modulation factor
MKRFPVYLSGTCLSAVLGVVLMASTHVGAYAAPAPMGYVQDRWDAPPPELSEMERRGFHDGIEGAHKDADNHRRFDVENRDEYRHPHVPERDREAYRHGFARGYQAGVDHMEREHHW